MQLAFVPTLLKMASECSPKIGDLRQDSRSDWLAIFGNFRPYTALKSDWPSASRIVVAAQECVECFKLKIKNDWKFDKDLISLMGSSTLYDKECTAFNSMFIL